MERAKVRKTVCLAIFGTLIGGSCFYLGIQWRTLKWALSDHLLFENRLDVPLRLSLAMMERRINKGTTYFGVRAEKCPLDHWTYQEIVCETRPDVIVEIGTFCGGGLLGLAHFCDLLDHGRVIGIDITLEHVAQVVRNHPRREGHGDRGFIAHV